MVWRLYAESAMLIEQESQIEHWRVVVLCPNRQLNFGRPAAVAGTAQEHELADVIAATLISRFNGRSINQLCAMGSITVDEFTQSVAYREIFGHGLQEGRQEWLQEGEAREAAKVTLRLLNRRCGTLSEAAIAQIQSLPVDQLEALVDALLDFQGPADLDAWLAGNT